MIFQIQTHLDTFERKYSESLAEKQALEDRRELMKVRMSRATELTSALDIEKVIYNLVYLLSN